MGYNSNCTSQDCSGGCCNFYGSCPEWFYNGNTLYTNCYYYYSINPSALTASIVASVIGIFIIVLAVCICYWHKTKQ